MFLLVGLGRDVSSEFVDGVRGEDGKIKAILGPTALMEQGEVSSPYYRDHHQDK